MAAAGYRKHIKRDLEVVSLGVESHSFRPDTFVSLSRVMREKLRVSVDRGSINPLMHFTYECFEKSAAKLDLSTLACRKGCSHCCNIWTDAYAPEIFFAAKQAVRNGYDATNNLLRNTAQFSSKVTFAQRDKLPIPCPLLIEDNCGIYKQRPLNCRTAISLDEEACRKAFIDSAEIDIPVASGWSNLGQIFSMALKGALFHAGLPCEPYEWNSAVHLAAGDPELERRWLRGENVLSGSPVARPAVPFTHPFWRGLYERAYSG